MQAEATMRHKDSKQQSKGYSCRSCETTPIAYRIYSRTYSPQATERIVDSTLQKSRGNSAPWCLGRPLFAQGTFEVSTPPPPCISYAKVPNQYGPYAYCSLNTGVACARRIQLPTPGTHVQKERIAW